MYLLLVFLPFIGSFSSLAFGRHVGSKGAAFITTGCLFVTFFLSMIAFYEVGISKSPCVFVLSNWISSGLFIVDWGFLFDSLTVVMLCVVTGVSAFVHLYSSGYMETDPHVPRFMGYLSLFTGFMLILVTSNNYLQMFLGWEGIGLASYLLIGFWYSRIQANKAALKAMIVNRIGDFGLALGMLSLFSLSKSFDYATVFTTIPQFKNAVFFFFNYEIHAITLICSLLFVGAVGKSAQIGLHTWLPDAMEGPTPVSALIHAATLVTAGVFLICRSSLLFEFSPASLLIVAFFGACTCLFAATTGLLQNDLKKVIAYSTCSQLGYMVFACGLSGYSVSVFHLANHAFFKALLFLSAGCVIHALADEQDMRKMGGLLKITPYSYSMILIGSTALAGFPFLSGFYSKDVILELSYVKYSVAGHFAFFLGVVAAFCTAFYSTRLIYLTFITRVNMSRKVFENAHEGSFKMLVPLCWLSIGSVFGGFLFHDMIVGVGTDFFSTAIFISPLNSSLIDSHFLPQLPKFLPFIFTILGIVCAFILYSKHQSMLYSLKVSFLGLSLYRFLNKKWFFDKIYNEMINSPFLNFSFSYTYKTLDKGLFESLGPYGLSNTVFRQSVTTLPEIQSGHLYHYSLLMLLGVLSFLAIIFLQNTFLYIDVNILLLLILAVAYAE